jgi:hypothetical protein
METHTSGYLTTRIIGARGNAILSNGKYSSLNGISSTKNRRAGSANRPESKAADRVARRAPLELARISHTLTSPRLIFKSTTNFLRSEIHPGIPLPQKIRCESKSLRDHLVNV